MQRWWRRVQRWGEHRLPALTRYRRAEPLPIELHRRRIYIVPTAFGAGFSVLLLVMLVGSLNYANNAALLLTCLLGAASAASMLVTFRNLDGLRLEEIRPGPAIAGEDLPLVLEFRATRGRSALRIDLEQLQHAFAVDQIGRIELKLPTQMRGWQPLPRMRVSSTWPLGMFRAWSWLHPQQPVLVWPRPEAGGPAPRGWADATRQRRLQRGEDLAALRTYRSGDPLRHIAWKASARHLELLTKEFEQPQPDEDWQLDWRHMHGLDTERRLARLACWLDEAEASGRRYSLWLPNEQIAAGQGPLHYVRCMNALAAMP